MINYFYCLQNMVKICDEFRKSILVLYEEYEKAGGLPRYICYLPRYRQLFEPIKKTIEMCDFLGIERLENK